MSRDEKEKIVKYRSAYQIIKYPTTEFKSAYLSDQSKAILDQLDQNQSFVWYGLFDQKTQSIRIEILPTCEFDTPEEKRCNKYGKPFSYQGKVISVISSIEGPRAGTGRIHVEGAKELKINEDGIGTGTTCAGGGWFGKELRFRSTSHNSFAFMPDPLFVDLYQDEIKLDNIKREAPKQIRMLTGNAFLNLTTFSLGSTNRIEPWEEKFESMPPEMLKEKLQKKLLSHIKNGKHLQADTLIRDCEDAKISLNLQEAMWHAIQLEQTKIISLLISNKNLNCNQLFSCENFSGIYLDFVMTKKEFSLKQKELVDLFLKKTDLSQLADPKAALFFALKINPPNKPLVKSLLEIVKIDLNAESEAERGTFLQRVISAGQHIDIIKLVLEEAKATPDDFVQALELAVRKQPEDFSTTQYLWQQCKEKKSLSESKLKLIFEKALIAGAVQFLHLFLQEGYLTNEGNFIVSTLLKLREEINPKTLEMFLQYCPQTVKDISKQALKRQKKLFSYIEKGKRRKAEKLIRECEEAKIPLNLHEAVFHTISFGPTEMVRLFISNENLNCNQHVSWRGYSGTILDHLIRCGLSAIRKKELVDLFLKKTDLSQLADPKAALFFALKINPPNKPLVKSLLEIVKIDLNAESEAERGTFLQRVISAGQHIDIIKLVLEEAKATPDDFVQALELAVRKQPEDFSTTQYLWQQCKEKKSLSESKLKLIFEKALIAGAVQFLHLFLQEGYLTNEGNFIVSTLLKLREEINPKILEMLLQYCSQIINMQAPDKQTLLHRAVLARNNVVVEMLLKSGIDINIADGSGHTALALANSCGNQIAIELILKYQSQAGRQTSSSNNTPDMKNDLTPCLVDQSLGNRESDQGVVSNQSSLSPEKHILSRSFSFTFLGDLRSGQPVGRNKQVSEEQPVLSTGR